VHQIVQAKQSNHLLILVNYGWHRNRLMPSLVFNGLEGFHHQEISIHRDGIAGYQVGGGEVWPTIGAAFQQAQGLFHFIAAQPSRCRGDGGGFLL
jgi:hypothetical protein